MYTCISIRILHVHVSSSNSTTYFPFSLSPFLPPFLSSSLSSFLPHCLIPSLLPLSLSSFPLPSPLSLSLSFPASPPLPSATMSATCSRYIPRIRYESETSRTVQCIPIFSCNALVSGTVPVQWWRFDSKSVRERVLESGGNSEPQYLLRNTTPFLINDSEHTLEIGFPSTKYSVVGYYATMFRLNGQNVTGQQFTVYCELCNTHTVCTFLLHVHCTCTCIY